MKAKTTTNTIATIILENEEIDHLLSIFREFNQLNFVKSDDVRYVLGNEIRDQLNKKKI